MASLPLLLSALVGFLSLSEEILWVRVAGFAWHSEPPAFSFVLAMFLVGIALGAVAGRRICDRATDLYRAAALVLLAAAALDCALPRLIGAWMPARDDMLLAPALLVIATAGIKSLLFPIVHHLGSASAGPRVGRSVSRVYFANIMGATLGPLLTGFVALDHLGVDACFALSGWLCLAGAALALSAARTARAPALAGLAATLALAAVLAPRPGATTVLAGMAGTDPRAPPPRILANRHGVIHVVPNVHGDVIFGGNVYDGVAGVDVDGNVNRLDRSYLAALLVAHPRRVLFIGLSTGAWATCYLGMPEVERIDVVEINPGYLELIRGYPPLARLLDDPRVHVHVDDGRRWLRRHPGERYDVIVQNTSFYWRARAAGLLSREYQAEVATHLEPGGVVGYNSTSSPDVLATAAAVHRHAYRYTNFVYASDVPLALEPARLERVLRPDGQPFRLEGAPPGSVAWWIARARLDEVGEFMRRRAAFGEVITDDNLLVEYRDGARFGPVILHALLPPLKPPFTDGF